MPDTTPLENDLRAIEALNKRHTAAVLVNDWEAVMSEWSEDFSVLLPAGPIVRGRNANAAIVRSGIEQMRAFEPIEYVEHFEEIEVAGNYAFEWGTYRGTSRRRAGGDSLSYGGKLLRILRREPGGSWKMYRTMTTVDPTS
jgi:ketosteroid isomerase-like protein